MLLASKGHVLALFGSAGGAFQSEEGLVVMPEGRAQEYFGWVHLRAGLAHKGLDWEGFMPAF